MERGIQVASISVTVCRILQKAGFSRRVYKILTGKNGCLLKEINAVEIAWIVSLSIVILKFITVMYRALSAVNEQKEQGNSDQLRTESLL